MEFADVVRHRRMTRAYDPDRVVPESVVEMLIKQAFRAPSAGHTQGRRFLILDDITSRQRYWSATSTGPSDKWRTHMQDAPVLIVCFSDRPAYLERYARADKRSSDQVGDGDDWAIPYWHVDTGMSAMILLLAAEDAGLGACFFGVPPRRWSALAEAFHVPHGLEPVGVVSLGYARADGALRRPRRALKSFDDLVSYRSFASGAGG